MATTLIAPTPKDQTYGPFQPCYLLEHELSRYGLPEADVQCDIMSLIGMASAFIDVECGRVDSDGSGSLVYTTYVNRILMQTRNRNLIQVPVKPLVALTQDTVDDLLALATAAPISGNYFYTGVQANTYTGFNGELSAFNGASGRYGYTRMDMQMGFPDMFAMINPLNLVTLFGGPAPWVAIDIGNMEYSDKIGEVWIPAGLQLQKYSEVLLVYNAGFHPLKIPPAIKYVCAALVKNALVRGDGTTALMSLNVPGAVTASWQQDLFDITLRNALTPFIQCRAY